MLKTRVENNPTSTVVFNCKNCGRVVSSTLSRGPGSKRLGTTHSSYDLVCCEECMEEFLSKSKQESK